MTTSTNTIKTFTRALVVLTLLISCQAAFAQANDRMLVTVPFAFAAGKASLPAGEYLIYRRGMNGVELRATDSDAAAILTTTPLDVDRAGERAQLVFHRYDGKYYFAGAQTFDGEMVFKAPRTQEERQLATAGARHQVVLVSTR